MTGDKDAVVQAILNALTSAERLGGVAYLGERRLEGGQTFQASPTAIVAPSPCYLAFIDPSPSANWGHDCRYLMIDTTTGQVRSHTARFPPFGTGDEGDWRLIYRAPGIPDTLIFGSDNRRTP
jgi:hypothetical protein